MPTVDLSDETFQRLQKFATPLVDTPETAISKILDLAEKVGTKAVVGFQPTTQAPDLSHTKVTSAKVGGRLLPPALCNWNAILLTVVHEAAGHLPPGVKLTDLIVVNFVEGEKTDSGYKFQPALGLSIQGQDSNSALRAIAHLASETGVPVEVTFVWYDVPKAAHPGKGGNLIA